MSSNSWNIIGATGTILFGVLTIVFYIRSRKVKKPRFVYDYATLQTQGHKDVEILFKGEKISNLSISHILYYNNGTKEIRKEDIPLDSYTYIEFNEDVKLLSYDIVATCKNPIGFKIKQEGEKRLYLIFEYLNPGDGAVIEILYDNSEIKGFSANCRSPLVGANQE